MDLQLNDKVAIVTGSSAGLGLASARALVGEGCRVVICARGAEALRRARRALATAAGRGGRVLAVAADVSTPAGAATRRRRSAIDAFGRLDILVNNVGKAGGGDIVSTPDAEWQSALDQTLFPAIRMSRLAVPHMRRAGGGVILMIASIWGRESGGRMTYNAVKAAEISLAKAMAQQLAKDNIRVNSVAPGSILVRGRHRGGSASRKIRKASPSSSRREIAVRPLRPRRRSRRRRRVSRVAARELGHGRVRDRGRRTEPAANI